MNVPLSEILEVVGSLDDTAGEDTARERFRRFLKRNVTEVGQIRDYVNECLRTSGQQYNRALQDLVNLIGTFLEFNVTYGRYSGVTGQIGFDGYWRSPTKPNGFHVVVETKTTEVYAIKTAALLGYINNLISDKTIPSREEALGLYVIGRPDPELKQLENAIVAERRSDQLRIISVESLLSLAEMMNEYDVTHEDILALIRPSGPTIDPILDLMARLVVPPQEPPKGTVIETATTKSQAEPIEPQTTVQEPEASYWLTPVKSDEKGTAEDTIRTLVRQEHIYAFGERTPGRKSIKPGDWICFYSTRKGVVAHARVASIPRNESNPHVRHPERYPWVFDLDSEVLYLDDPVVIDPALRSRLDAFKGRDVNANWAWYVQATNRITEHDFSILARKDE